VGRSRTSTRQPPTPEELNELARLWEEFKQSEVSGAREGARERLILHYAPLVKYVASRVATGLPASVDQADLVSYGMFGLIDALEKFDPGRGNKFETYAIPRIKGAIIDELRAMDWVPRSVRFKAREIEKAYSDLESIHKRAPDREGGGRAARGDAARAPRGHQPDLVRAGAAARRDPERRQRPRRAGVAAGHARRSRHRPDDGARGAGDAWLLAAAINSLSEREKIVVTLYYFEGLTLAEIGEILGVTESRVCQIHTKAVGQLRLQLVETE
jgi:RNA polymerase sigma factor for flagellar operon FliA